MAKAGDAGRKVVRHVAAAAVRKVLRSTCRDCDGVEVVGLGEVYPVAMPRMAIRRRATMGEEKRVMVACWILYLLCFCSDKIK